MSDRVEFDDILQALDVRIEKMIDFGSRMDGNQFVLCAKESHPSRKEIYDYQPNENHHAYETNIYVGSGKGVVVDDLKPDRDFVEPLYFSAHQLEAMKLDPSVTKDMAIVSAQSFVDQKLDYLNQARSTFVRAQFLEHIFDAPAEQALEVAQGKVESLLESPKSPLAIFSAMDPYQNKTARDMLKMAASVAKLFTQEKQRDNGLCAA